MINLENLFQAIIYYNRFALFSSKHNRLLISDKFILHLSGEEYTAIQQDFDIYAEGEWICPNPFATSLRTETIRFDPFKVWEECLLAPKINLVRTDLFQGNSGLFYEGRQDNPYIAINERLLNILPEACSYEKVIATSQIVVDKKHILMPTVIESKNRFLNERPVEYNFAMKGAACVC